MRRIKASYLYQFCAAIIHMLLVKINPKLEMNRYYRKVFGRKIDFDNPRDLIEKTYWLQLNSDTSMWTRCADKYAMRGFVAEKGFATYLPKLLGRWESPDDISFDDLPNEFILKTNNGCKQNIVVRDKSRADLRQIRKTFKRWMKIPYGYSGGELHYTRIKPCIIAEELLKQSSEQASFSPHSLVDYKVWCFSGVPECILVVFDRGHDGYCLDMYDLNWTRINYNLKNNGHYHSSEVPIPKPVCLDLMLSIASQLSSDFPEVRIDFYVIGEKPIIGELTFTSGFGNYTNEFYDYLGTKVNISNFQ